MTEDARVSWFSLFAGLLAASLATAAVVVYAQRGWGQPSAAPVFLFSFAYAFVTGILIGLPLLGRMVRKRALNWRTAAAAGGATAAFPGLLFLIFVASCATNASFMGVATCTDGVRNLAGWALSVALLAALGGMGAAAGLIGYLVYRGFRSLMLSQPKPEDEPDPPPA